MFRINHHRRLVLSLWLETERGLVQTEAVVSAGDHCQLAFSFFVFTQRHIVDSHYSWLNLLRKFYLKFILVCENDVHALIVIMVGHQEEVLFPRIDVVRNFAVELWQSLDMLGTFRDFFDLLNLWIRTVLFHLTRVLIYCLTLVAIDLVILQNVVVISVDQNDFGKVAVDLAIERSVVIFEVGDRS